MDEVQRVGCSNRPAHLNLLERISRLPSRIVREGINTSARINSLSPMAEIFYRRLMNVADDYGRFYASPTTLRAHCWPTCPEKLTDETVSHLLSECLATDNPLLIKYEFSGVAYVEIQNFGQQTRTKSKFPDPKQSKLLINCEADAQPSRISESYFGVVVDSRISDARGEAALAPTVDAESKIRRLAEDCPDQQDFETGVDCAVRALMSSANPATTLRTMQDNLPLWWAAMREGRARTKPMRYVIVDKDYLRVPAATVAKEKKRIPNYRAGEIE